MTDLSGYEARNAEREKIKAAATEGPWERYGLIGHGTKPHREFKWHPERKWRADFYFAPRLLVELEGGGGRHHSFKGYSDDCEKYNEAALHGFIVLRFTPIQLRDGASVAELVKQVRARKAG